VFFPAAATAAKNGTARLFLQNITASSQVTTGSFLYSTLASTSPSSPSAINTANVSYIGFYETNTVNADNCFINSASVQ
jgi:hypothetical protein